MASSAFSGSAIQHDSPVIGIDLGTSKASVAVYSKNLVRIIPNEYESRYTPCYVSFDHEKRSIGEDAERSATMNVNNTVYGVKRLIGMSINDEVVKNDIGHVGFDIVPSGNRPKIQVQYRSNKEQFCAEEISGMIIGKLKKTAEKFIGVPVTQAVISVPAKFDDAQKAATKNAGKIAGLENVFLIDETTAAAYTYLHNREINKVEKILIFDLGAGCFSVSICELGNDGSLRVVASRGNAHLGGTDFDRKMVGHFAVELKSQHGLDVSKDKKARMKLRLKCEKAKKTLSGTNSATLLLDLPSQEINFESKIKRTEFDKLNEEFYKKIDSTVYALLHNANWPAKDVDQVILVGGSSRIPKVEATLLQIFKDKSKINKTLDADEAVVRGAAIYAKHGSPTDMPTVGSPSVPISAATLLNTNSKKKGPAANTALPYKNLTENEVRELASRAKQLDENDREWAEIGEARNDLEKIAHTCKQMTRTGTQCKTATAQQKKEMIEKCGEVLVWLECNQNASVEECEKQKNVMTKVWNAMVDPKPGLQRKEVGASVEERNRRQERHELQSLIFKVVGETAHDPGRKTLHDQTLQLEDWVENNPKEKREVYGKKYQLLQNDWMTSKQTSHRSMALARPMSARSSGNQVKTQHIIHYRSYVESQALRHSLSQSAVRNLSRCFNDVLKRLSNAPNLFEERSFSKEISQLQEQCNRILEGISFLSFEEHRSNGNRQLCLKSY